MSKPREFWILDFANGKRQVSESSVTYDQEFFGPGNYDRAMLPRKITHVREVVPIDWVKIWEKSDIGVLELSERLIIQHLVEKALAGEK